MHNEQTSIYKDIIRLALPLTVGTVSQMLLTITDSMMLGHLSYNHLAASAFVNNYMGIPSVACIGLTTAIGPLISFRINTKAKAESQNLLIHGLILNFVIVLCVIIALSLSIGLLHQLKQDPNIVDLSIPFFKWINWSILPMILFLSMKQYCDGMEKTTIPLIISLLAIPLNVFINYVLIYGNLGFPRMELEGSGIATFITRSVCCISIAIFVYNSDEFAAYKTSKFSFAWSEVRNIARLAFPSSWQYANEIGAFAILAIVIGQFGAQQLAAHQIAISIAALTFMISVGISSAAAIKVGECYGQGDISSARKYGLSSFNLAAIYGLICALVFLLFRNLLPCIFTEDSEVIRIAASLLLFGALFQISDSIQSVSIGALRGLQDVNYPSVITTIAYWCIGIPLGYFLAIHVGMKSEGVWIGFIVCLTFVSVFLYLRFNKRTRI